MSSNDTYSTQPRAPAVHTLECSILENFVPSQMYGQNTHRWDESMHASFWKMEAVEMWGHKGLRPGEGSQTPAHPCWRFVTSLAPYSLSTVCPTPFHRVQVFPVICSVALEFLRPRGQLENTWPFPGAYASLMHMCSLRSVCQALCREGLMKEGLSPGRTMVFPVHSTDHYPKPVTTFSACTKVGPGFVLCGSCPA